MMDRGAAERACKDPNPIVDGRKANVNLAYLGAKPRSPQTGESCAHTHTETNPTHTQTQTHTLHKHVSRWHANTHSQLTTIIAIFLYIIWYTHHTFDGRPSCGQAQCDCTV